ncbi:MAG: dTMP kinase [Salinivirgaceae bacterium]|jgi:dTMP kinase|nr:dTMP kinase [Salinivirgaceae bacterium]
MNKFIVLEGLDGSGKSTQITKLKNYFDEHGIGYKYLHFPQTHTPYFGEMISRFLRGEFGKIDQVDPYLVAMLYAGDRFDSAANIREWLDIGSIVLVDRYVMSNIAFQTAKLKDIEAKKRLREWIFKFEYTYYQLPRPGLSMFLDVPISFVKQNIENDRGGDDRAYLQGKEDIHEASIDFQQCVRNEYLEAIKLDQSFKNVNCIENNTMKSPDAVFSEIISLLKEHKVL